MGTNMDSTSFLSERKKVTKVGYLVAILSPILHVLTVFFIIPSLSFEEPFETFLFVFYFLEICLSLMAIYSTIFDCPNYNRLVPRPVIVEIDNNTDTHAYIRNKIDTLLVLLALEALATPVLFPLVLATLRFNLIIESAAFSAYIILYPLILVYLGEQLCDYLNKEKMLW